MSDPLMDLLARLPSTELDRARAEAIRARCHARLARTSAPVLRAPGSQMKTIQVWQPLIAVLGMAYLAEVIVQAVRVSGVP